MSQRSENPAHELAGRYELLGILGSGGMGTVWRALDRTLGREVAMKEVTLAADLDDASRAEACARAVREAQAAAQLRHPGIIVVHDAFIDGDRPWIVMQLLQGQSLEDMLKARGPVAPSFSADLGLQVVRALAVAHAAGILHRDIKPGNIFLTSDDRAILTDFGIATVEGQATITRSGMLVGSPGYIAPERLRGELPGPQSDLWSLAATLYRAVEGVPPHEGYNHMIVLTKVLTEDPRPPAVAGELAPLLLHMLAKDPRSRPEPGVVEEVLARVAAGSESGAIPLPPPPPPPAEIATTVDASWRPPDRRRLRPKLLAPLFAAGVALLVALATVVFLQSRQQPETISSPQTVSPTSAPTPTATVTPTMAAAEFTVPIDFCTIVTVGQVRRLIPQFKKSRGKNGGEEDSPACAWDAPGAGIELRLVNSPLDSSDPWGRSPEDAHDTYMSRFQSGLKGSSKVIWHYSGIGGESITSGPETKAETLKGVGDEAFVSDTKGRLGAQKTDVLFRISNIIIEVTHADVTNKTGGRKIHDRTVQMARWASESLSRR